MVETSLEAMNRLLNESLETCEDEECNFRIRTALQICSAMQAELDEAKGELRILERAISEDAELRETLLDLGLDVQQERRSGLP